MLSITRLGHLCVPAFVLGLFVLTCSAIIPETLAQTPSVALASLVSKPLGSIGLRPRRVSDLAGNNPEPWPVAAIEIEKSAFERTNAAREENGLAPLVWDEEICRMARMHSQNMGLLGFFSHETPEGLRMTDRARALGIAHFRMLGENIAYNQGYEDPGGFAVEQWLLSPGHRANILRAEFQQSAIGVFVAADGTVYLTQEFITRSTAADRAANSIISKRSN